MELLCRKEIGRIGNGERSALGISYYLLGHIAHCFAVCIFGGSLTLGSNS